MNRQAVDMWTMRFAHRRRAAAFDHMTTAFHHV